MPVPETAYCDDYDDNITIFVSGCSQKTSPERFIPPTSAVCTDDPITYLHDCVYRHLLYYTSDTTTLQISYVFTSKKKQGDV